MEEPPAGRPHKHVPARNPTYREVIAGIGGWLLVGVVAGSLLISPFAQAFFALLVGSVIVFLVVYQLLHVFAETPQHVPAVGPDPPDDDPD